MMDTLDNGKPLRETEGDIADGVHTFRYYAGLIKAPYGGGYGVMMDLEKCTLTKLENQWVCVPRLHHGIILFL